MGVKEITGSESECGKFRVRVVKAKVFEDRKLAKEYEASIQQAVYQADQDFVRGIVHSAVVTSEKIEEFIEYRRIEARLTPDTLRNYRKRLEYIFDTMSCETLQDITRDDIFKLKRSLSGKSGQSRRHQKGVGLSPDTVNQYLQVLRQYINYARNVRYEVRGFLPCETALTPIRTSEKIQGGRYVPEVLYPAEIVELLGILKEYNIFVWAMMCGVWCTARRPAQLAQIKWRDYTPPVLGSAGVIRIIGGKGGPAGSMPIAYGGALHGVIEKLRDASKKINLDGYLFCTPRGKIWNTSYLWARFKQGLKGNEKYAWVSPYAFKHSAVTHIQECPGITAAQVQAQAGHSRITSQEAYSHRDRTSLESSVLALEEVL